MKYYCTKYWATKGIVEFDGNDVGDGYVRGRGHGWSLFLRLGTEVFTCLDDAEVRVVELAKQDADNLRSRLTDRVEQLAKMRAGDFKFRLVRWE